MAIQFHFIEMFKQTRKQSTLTLHSPFHLLPISLLPFLLSYVEGVFNMGNFFLKVSSRLAYMLLITC